MKDDMRGLTVHIKGTKDFSRKSGDVLPEISPSDMRAAGGEASNAPGETICLPSGAKVTPKLMKAARQGEFVNLSDFSPCLEPSVVTETSLINAELVFKPKRTMKTIDSFLLWSMAWWSYEQLLVEADVSRYADLVDY